MEAAARFVPKEAIAANRADADARMAAAAMLRDPEAVDRDPNMQGVAAWEKLIASHDPVHPNNDRIDVLIKRMDDIAENFRTQHEQHQITFKQQADLHMTSCAQVRQYYVGSTNAQYAIAQGENAALRVSTSRCKVTAAHSPLTPTSPGGRGASRQLLIRPNRDRSAIATFSGREKGPELRDYGPFLRPALRAGFAVRSGICPPWMAEMPKIQ